MLPCPTEAVSDENNEDLPCSKELNPVWKLSKFVKYVLGIFNASPNNPLVKELLLILLDVADLF